MEIKNKIQTYFKLFQGAQEHGIEDTSGYQYYFIKTMSSSYHMKQKNIY